MPLAIRFQKFTMKSSTVKSWVLRKQNGPTDLWDKLEEETQAAGSPLSKKIYYEYNTLGKLTSKNLSGTAIQYTHNKDGNLHKMESSP